MFSLYAARSSLVLCLFLNNHHPYFFSSLLHASPVYALVQLAYAHVASTTMMTAGFSSLLFIRQEENEGGQRKENKGRETLMNNARLFSRLVSLITNSFCWPTHSALDKSLWAKSVSRCVYRSASGGEKRKSILFYTLYVYFLFFYSYSCNYIYVNDVNRKYK